jgi:hypothetical protein
MNNTFTLQGFYEVYPNRFTVMLRPTGLKRRRTQGERTELSGKKIIDATVTCMESGTYQRYGIKNR